MGELNEEKEVVVSEMTIVDTFTKLIFAVDDVFLTSELAVIAALRAVEASVYRDSVQELGEYLRNLGVREMIQLVARVASHMRENHRVAPHGTEIPAGAFQRPH